MFGHRKAEVWAVTATMIGIGCADPTTILGADVDDPATQGVSGYPIVDTGQDSCFDAHGVIACPAPGASYYGQDAQRVGDDPSYTASDDGLTVFDHVTGLTWTRSPDLDRDGDIDRHDKLSFVEAVNYPASTLNPADFGGYDDWRLPTMKELYSLIDFRGSDPNPMAVSAESPFIDTEAFEFGYGDVDGGERVIDAQFWSSEAYLATVFDGREAAFGLNLADGRIKGYPSSSEGFRVHESYVYFVRGNPEYGVNAFADNGDGTVIDEATGLMWTRDDSGEGMTWEQALAWTQARNAEGYLGHDDWRLPDAKELQSIVDYSRAPDATGSAALDPLFGVSQITNEAGESDYPSFWSSTTHIGDGGNGRRAVYLCFGRCMGNMDGVWMDVHGAGSQRSDPKEGDPEDFPDGFGPQGDAIRIHNYVRLVRNR